MLRIQLFVIICLALMCSCSQDYTEYSKANCNFEGKLQANGKILLTPRDCIIGAKLPQEIQAIITEHLKPISPKRKDLMLINFWFLQCHSCIKEIPDLNQINEIIPIISFCRDSQEDIQRDSNINKINYPVNSNSSIICDSILRIFWGYPTNLLVSKDFYVIENFGPLTDGSPAKVKLLNYLQDGNYSDDKPK